MKKKLFLLSILGILFLITGCTMLPTNKTVPLTDRVIKEVAVSLPANWRLEQNDSELRIFRTKPAMVIFENKINAPVIFPVPSREELNKKMETLGKLTVCELRYKLEPRWSDQELTNALADNAALQTKVDALPHTYRIESLYDDSITKNGPAFRPTTPPEEQRVAAYESEKRILEATRRRLPDGDTELYSLFLTSDTCRADEYTTIWPPEAAEEIWHTRQAVTEIITKKI